eukprot:scaffold6852_cov201-Skeletonema_marinoi.AAC.2
MSSFISKVQERYSGVAEEKECHDFLHHSITEASNHTNKTGFVYSVVFKTLLYRVLNHPRGWKPPTDNE